jgi:hypothetical protein
VGEADSSLLWNDTLKAGMIYSKSAVSNWILAFAGMVGKDLLKGERRNAVL